MEKHFINSLKRLVYNETINYEGNSKLFEDWSGFNLTSYQEIQVEKPRKSHFSLKE